MHTLATAYEVAAFTSSPSAGSPTGVVLNASALTDAEMQRIACQFNYSHTVFVSESDDTNAGIHVRFFTPLREIANCAHATIAAHYLRASQLPDKRDFTVKQRTMSGVQDVQIRYADDMITVHFRQHEIKFSDVASDTLVELRTYLRLPHAALDSAYPVMLASPGENRFMLALKDRAAMDGLKPDFAALKVLCRRHDSIGCFAFIIESSAPTVEATGRMFAPAIGVNEDIINGNSSGCLGAYLLPMIGAAELDLRVHQGHAFNRPGTVLVTARRTDNRIETHVGGTAAIVSLLTIPQP